MFIAFSGVCLVYGVPSVCWELFGLHRPHAHGRPVLITTPYPVHISIDAPIFDLEKRVVYPQRYSNLAKENLSYMLEKHMARRLSC